MYFVGFRRNLVLTEEEKAVVEKEKQEEEALKRSGQGVGSSKKKGKMGELKEGHRKTKKKQVPGWGEWYEFIEGNLRLPEFFHAESCGVPAGYSDR